MHDCKLLTHALDSLWEKYQKRLADCQHAAGEEAVHKLRIGTRRLLSLIELLQALTPQPALRKLRKALKAQLDGFDQLRDTQVMLLEISGALEALPELAPFQQHLRLTEQRLVTQTPLIIETIRSKTLHRLLEKTRKHLLAEFGKSELKQRVLSVIDNTYQTALERYQAIDSSQPATIHRLRIAVKKLRYMLASAQMLLPALPENHPRQLQDYLTLMGEIQNSRVFLSSLTSFFADQPPASVQTHYQQRHRALLDVYMDRRAELLRFWRSEPNQAFPWEF